MDLRMEDLTKNLWVKHVKLWSGEGPSQGNQPSSRSFHNPDLHFCQLVKLVDNGVYLVQGCAVFSPKKGSEIIQQPLYSNAFSGGV